VQKTPFELEWTGGPAAHHFRKARPEIEDLPWDTLEPAAYAPALVTAVRGSWTELAMNEYRAFAFFAEVLHALALARAPLDLLGMASDFVADEALHVELASRIAMELGGAEPRHLDLDSLSIAGDRTLTPFERANEVVLRVSCVAETFSGGMGRGAREVSKHPLLRGVYDIVLADEARHERFGGLYFEWANERIDDAERVRLAGVAAETLRGLSSFWTQKDVTVIEGKTRQGWNVADIHALGWLEAARAATHARAVVTNDVLPQLDALGIVIPANVRADLLSR
jgi:hypothetical protein